MRISQVVSASMAYLVSYYAFGISFGFVLTLSILPNLWVPSVFLDTLPLNIFCFALAIFSVFLANKIGKRTGLTFVLVFTFGFSILLWSNFLVIDAEHRLAATSSVFSMLIGSCVGVIAQSNSKNERRPGI